MNKDFSTIPNKIDEMLQKIIDSLVKREKFVTYEAIKTPIMIKGGGFMGELFKINIKGKTNEVDKEINVFIKHTIPNSILDELFPLYDAFLLECFVYKELAKVFENIQEDAKVPKEERFKMIKGFEESTTTAIVLENMTCKGFKIGNRMELREVEFIELALNQLAKLHALGFVLEKNMPEFFDKKIRPLKYPIVFNKAWKNMADILIKISIKNLGPEARKKAEEFIPIFFNKYEKHLNDRSSINTICHGDFRANNIMVKEMDGNLAEVITIDYQTLHYGSPANDILHILYGCTDQKFRNDHKDRLIDLYYQTLADFLWYFEINAADVCPRKKLDKALEERVDYGLMSALYFYPIYFAPEDDVPDVTNDDVSSIDFDLHPEIVKRLEDIIDEYYRDVNN